MTNFMKVFFGGIVNIAIIIFIVIDIAFRIIREVLNF